MTLHIIYGPHTSRLSETPDEATENRLRDLLAYEPKATTRTASQKFVWDPITKKRVFNKFYKEDPRSYLYHRGHRNFPTGMLTKVQQLLGMPALKGYPATTPKPQPWKLVDSFTENGRVIKFEPRYYQRDAVAALTQAGRGVAILPTGTGKTAVCAMLATSYPTARVLITVPNKRLLHQNRDEVAKFMGTAVGILGDSEKDLKPRVVVATIQSIVSRIEAQDPEVLAFLKDTQVWLSDESHGAASDSYRELSRVIVNAHIRFGLTATWIREDGCELVMEGVLGDVLYEYTYDQAFQDGYLTPIRVWIRKILHRARRGPRKPDFTWFYTKHIVENDGRNLQIALDAADFVDAGITPCLVMVKRKEHGKRLADMLGCQFVDGDSATKKVDVLLEKFMAGEFPVLVASGILNVGVNLRELRAALNASGGDSRIDALQKPGRGLRLHGSKTHFDYVDYFDEEANFFRSHSSNRRFTYKQNFPGRVKDIKLESVPRLLQTLQAEESATYADSDPCPDAIPGSPASV